MNIVITTPIFPPDIGGPATYAYELLNKLSQKKHKVTVATLSQAAKHPNVHVIQRRRLRLPALLLTYFISFYRLLRITRGCDIIYTQTPSYLGLASLLVARLRQKPIVLRFVGDGAWERAFNSHKTEKLLEDFLRKPVGGMRIRMVLRMQRFVINGVNRIIVPSHFLKEVLIDHYGIKAEKVAVIYNSIDLKDYKFTDSQCYQKSGTTRLITIGRLIRHKRVGSLLKIVKELLREYPHVILQIVGDGPDKVDLQTLSRNLDIAKQVEFHGRLSHHDAMTLLRQADVFILNSVYEGFPHTIIEAMMCRVPVIVTDIGGNTEVVKDNVTGLLVTIDNDKQLEERIVLLVRDKTLRERLAVNACQSVLQNFTWERNLALLERVLQRVINGSTAP